ncbi:hypothetical protein, conserved [Plasmodium gonderi]|uniref:Enhancer of polycomb-like protein n=1 Tax=Plasmodium gonderi TaxID=77519 RepID=A0A1Y1JLF1_PLAGO|nr:hypothetical protein, conserved [Plasmodium gonderi]GAW83376.1 hypothetical protein, conserved [Plasmodium gonderi]
MTKGTTGGHHGRNSKNKTLLINKKLLIVKSNEDIKKLIKNDNPTEEEVKELKTVLESSKLKTEKKKKKNIVIPRFKICEDDESYSSRLKTFEKPCHYIRYELYRDQVTGIKLTDGSIIHYDLLKEDEIFLESLNSYINIQVNDEDFCKLMDKFEKLTGYSENKEEINLKDALKAASDLKITLKSNVIKDIHTYWKSKRKKLGRPLLRMFWNNSQNILPHYSVFRSRVKEKMTLRKHKKKNSEIILKMQELIEDFRRLDRILRKMKQRDEKKLLLLQLNSILFDQRKNEIKDKTYVCPMWNYFKDYKMEKIYKKFKKDKYYKSLYSNVSMSRHHRLSDQLMIDNHATSSHYSGHHMMGHHSHDHLKYYRNNHSSNHIHNDSIVSRKINKRAKSQGLCEQMNILKINQNEYKNIVLIKRRGRGNRIWVDRKFVNEMNDEDMNCCDLSYTFNDFVEASLNLKKSYEDDLCNYISGKQKHIPIKLGIKSGDIKNLDLNIFSNQRNANQHPNDGKFKGVEEELGEGRGGAGGGARGGEGEGEEGRGTANGAYYLDDRDDDGGILFEKYEEMKKEKRKRKRKKDSENGSSSILHDHRNALDSAQQVKDELKESQKQTYLNNIAPLEQCNDYINYSAKNGNQTEDRRLMNSMFSKVDHVGLDKSTPLLGKYNMQDESNEWTKLFADKSGENRLGENIPQGINLTNDKTENLLSNSKAINNGYSNNKYERTNSVQSSNQSSYSKGLFHFDDLVNPQINKHNYIFCLSKYACVQKRILFYLENLLNFDNFNFKSKKKETNPNATHGTFTITPGDEDPTHQGEMLDKVEVIHNEGVINKEGEMLYKEKVDNKG